MCPIATPAIGCKPDLHKGTIRPAGSQLLDPTAKMLCLACMMKDLELMLHALRRKLFLSSLPCSNNCEASLAAIKRHAVALLSCVFQDPRSPTLLLLLCFYAASNLLIFLLVCVCACVLARL